MSDFASLLGQFQQDAKKLATSRPRSPDASEATSRKRSRTTLAKDAKDFPPVTKIFILCPASVQTGGPEALHQLCDQINKAARDNAQQHQVSAYMLYARTEPGVDGVSFASKAKTPDVYSAYLAPAVNYNALSRDAADPSHLMIWPECWTNEMLHYLDSNDNGKASPCAIWWLSVDNNTGRFQEWSRNDILHLYQSEYAHQHLLKQGAKHVYEVREFISHPPTATPDADRPIDILYNPLKGMHFTDQIRQRSQGKLLKFQPIGGGPEGRVRISPARVRQLLRQAKVYIDFGPHPGMDRLPREAALAGCLVVTNSEGSAAYDKDVPLPAKFKCVKFNADEIHKLLVDLVQHHKERSKEQDDYRTWILGQEARMKENVADLLVELIDKRKNPTGV